MRISRPDGRLDAGPPALTLSRVAGPEAEELFIACAPTAGTEGVGRQAESLYGTVVGVLASEGASFDAVVRETLHLRDLPENLAAVLGARNRVLDGSELPRGRPQPSIVEQPPLDRGADLELSVLAVVPHRRTTLPARPARGAPPPGCAASARPRVRLVRLADQTYLHAGSIYGPRGSAFDEAYGMFCAAESLLQAAGMSFRDVIRTWIYVRDIERDYGALNRARRAFFRERGIERRPASTGVGGGHLPGGQGFSMALYAIKSERSLRVELVSTGRLAEPWSYGSDFSRGLDVVEANKVALYVSGTASVDEGGRTVHRGDLRGQAGRMLANVSALLAARGASFRNVVSAVTYLKDGGDAPILRAALAEHGFTGFPNTLVEARLCRPDLLCETEVVAVLPLPQDEGGTRSCPE